MAKDDGLGLDFLTQIVNVQWEEGGGAIFVYGEWLGNKLHYVKVNKGTEPETQEIGLPESDTRDLEADIAIRFAQTGGSYGKKKKKDKEGNPTIDDKDSQPVFVICGTRSDSHTILDENKNPFHVTDTSALIYKSNDGISWSATHEQSAVTTISPITMPAVATVALVWDPDKQSFYYDQYRNIFHFNTDELEAFDEIFSSPDGGAWGMESRTDVVGADPATYKSDFLTHTEHNNCIDAFGNHVPDGFSTTDKKKKITVKPDKPPTVFYTGGGIGYGDGTSQAVIETEDAKGDKQTKTVSVPIANITCVAECNGILLAGGFVVADEITAAGAVAISTNNGDTWKHLADTQNGVVFMIVAPATDFPPEPTA